MRASEHHPTCERARAWVSAYRDAETLDDPQARSHLTTCEACTSWASTLDGITRRVRLRASGSPDVLGPALAAWRRQARAPRDRQTTAARVTLAVAGLGGFALALLGLLDVPGRFAEAGAHLGWELCSFEAALALGFLAAARRPDRYLFGLVPPTALVTALTLVPSAAGVSTARIDPLMELSHVAVLVGLVGLLLLLDVRRKDRPAGPRGVPAPGGRRPA